MNTKNREVTRPMLFHYAPYNEMLITRTLSLANLGVLLAVAIVFVALAVYVFRRRDIMVA